MDFSSNRKTQIEIIKEGAFGEKFILVLIKGGTKIHGKALHS